MQIALAGGLRAGLFDDRIVLMGDAASVAQHHTAMGTAKAAGDAIGLARAVLWGWTFGASSAFSAEPLSIDRASSIMAGGWVPRSA